MPDNDLPQGTVEDTTLSFDDGVDAISNLISDPETDLGGEIEAPDDAENPDGVEGDDAENPDLEPGQDDGPDGVTSGGKFVSGDAKFRLEDGTVISVSDLARNNLFQRDYTRKTTEHKAEVEAFKAERQQVNQYAQALAQQRDFILQAAAVFTPQKPDRSMLDPNSPNFDPYGYQVATADYDEKMQLLTRTVQQRQGDTVRQQQEMTESQKRKRAEEAQRLLEAVPEFKDRKVYEQFWSDAVSTMAENYGYSQEELAAVGDHRLYKALRDLVKYHKARKQAPQVKQDVQKRPQVLTGGRRMDPKARTSRESQARAERLRKEGTMEAGIAALMDLNL